MKKLKHCLVIFIYASFVSSYSQTVMFNPNEGKIKVKSVSSDLTLSAKQVESNHNPATEAAALAAILPAVIETGIAVVKSELKKREESYAAEYKINSSGEAFWLNDNIINLPNMTYTKQILKDGETEKKDAVKFTLEPFQSQDGKAFRYKLTALKMNYSEARANTKHSSLNLEIDVKFSAFVETEGKYTKSDLGQSSITVTGVEFDTNSVTGTYYTGWFPVLPREETSNPSGNYEIELTVKEANPGAISAKKIAQFFEDNGEKIQETSKIIIENIFTGKEDEGGEEATANTGTGTANDQTTAARSGH